MMDSRLRGNDTGGDMTTGLRFVKGARVLNLRGDVYQFERGFTPPATKGRAEYRTRVSGIRIGDG